MLGAIVPSGWLSCCWAKTRSVSRAQLQLLLWGLLGEARVLSPLPFVLTHFQEGGGAEKAGDKREE